MKRIFLFIITLSLAVSTLSAQSFKTLWKQFDQENGKDRPQTAIAILQQISRKAEAERSYGNLLAAYFMELRMQREVSNDSLEAAMARLKDYEKVLEKQDETAYWICRIAMMKYERSAYPAGLVDTLLTKYNKKGDFTRANAVESYVPLIKKGKDSRCFNNDLISVIGMETKDYDPLIAYYESVGNSKAVAVLNLERAKTEYSKIWKQKEQIAFIDSIVALYPNENETDYFRIERYEKTCPMGEMSFMNPHIPSQEQKISFFQVRNVREVEIFAKPLHGGKTISIRHKFPEHKDYEIFSDTVSLGKLPLGTYVVKAKWDGLTDYDGSDTLLISDLAVMAHPRPNNEIRFVVVNATSGKPVPEAQLQLSFRDEGKPSLTVMTDEYGEYVYRGTATVDYVCAKTATDYFKSTIYMRPGYNNNSGNRRVAHHVNIFIDRSIYRPGQKVHAAIVAFDDIDSKETVVAKNRDVTLTLTDAKHKKVGEAKVTTDDFGTAVAEFDLPEHGNNGYYNLYSVNGQVSFRVEEYVRPTFDVTLDEPEKEYHIGDTIAIAGHAKAYSGAGIGNSQVYYKITSSPSWMWRSSQGTSQIASDTIMTDADGNFSIPVPMMKRTGDDDNKYYCYNVSVETTVTNLAGESHSQSISLPLSNRSTFLLSNVKDKYLADSLITVTVSRRNAAARNIDGKANVYVDGNMLFAVDVNKPFNLPDNLASGKHSFKAICENDTVEKAFYVFRMTDKHPVSDTRDWWYQSANEFKEDGTYVQFGSAAHDGCAFYSITSGNKLIESGRVDVDSSLVTRKFVYKEEYGDGICYSVAWLKDGAFYQHEAVIKKPLPDKKLKLSWSTFRDKVQPGQQEEWKLSVTDSNGNPAASQVAAVLYDKSLDALYPHNWTFQDHRYLQVPNFRWQSFSLNGFWLDYEKDQKEKSYKPLSFSEYDNEYFLKGRSLRIRGVSRVAALKYSAPVAKKDGEEFYDIVLEEDNSALNEVVVVGYGTSNNASLAKEEVAATAEPVEEEVVPIRENFGETAFFKPRLLSDENGISTISFTLPESVTTWKFMALAHDKNMRFGTFTDEVVAQKKLMIQPLMPRFIYETDEASISANVSNISENDMNVTTCMTILDQKTEKVLCKLSQDVFVKAGESQAVMFQIAASNYGEGTFIVRFTAQNKKTKDGLGGESDGEQHLLPILSNRVDVVNTRALVLREKTNTVINVGDMLPSDVEKGALTVTYTDQPAWYMVKSLPYLKEDVDDNAISLATALYTNTLAYSIVSNNPDAVTMYDKTDLDYRKADICSRLSALQSSDGSWPWWKGMTGSDYITTAVLQMLLRMNKLAGVQSDTKALISRAFKYLDAEAEKDIKKMEDNKKKGVKPSLYSWHTDYLYCMSLAGRTNGNSKYLLPLLEDMVNDRPDMATKAEAAVILALNGKEKAASDCVESLLQHTVYREDVGRYFDSYRAGYSWKDYRIPTQVWAIEALSYVSSPSAASGKAREEMQRWLLSSKRTQSWDTPLNAVNAIYAFFDGDASNVKPTEPQVTKGTLTHKKPTIPVKKETDHESWMAVNVAFKQDVDKVEAASEGFTVERKIVGDATKVGNKVKVVITITADRDYDFVTVTDNRPACLEPVQQLSGFRNGAYTVQHDTNTEYCFDMFRKGKHTIETEYYVNRTGNYTSGITTVKCTYAPEFTGRTSAEKLTIGKR